jgi:multiple sugar transport system substrate-binding protein
MNLNMAKKTTLLVSALLGTAILAGCNNVASSTSTGSTASSSSNPSQSVPSSSSAASSYVNYDPSLYGDPTALTATVTFWTTNGGQNLAALNGLKTLFNKTYPNITINISGQGGYPDIQTKIGDAIAAGTTPTIAYCYPDHVANYLDAGAVMNLQNFVDDPTIGFLKENEADEGYHTTGGVDYYGADDYVQGYWNEGKAYQTSGLYSVPFTKSTEALYFNQTVFDQKGWNVPETWDQMWSLCDTIKSSYPDYIPLGYDSDSNLFISGCASTGISYTSSTGAHYLFNNPGAKALMQTWVDKYNAGELVTEGTLPNNAYTSTDFTQQKILMIVSSTGGASYADTTNFNVGVSALPSYTGHDLKIISQGPSLCFFQRGTWAQKYAAWLFYKFCTRSEWSARFAVASTGYDPVRISSYATPYYASYLSDNADTIYGRTSAVTANLRDDIFYSPVFVGSSTARSAVGTILSLVALSGDTIDQAFQAAYDECITG